MNFLPFVGEEDKKDKEKDGKEVIKDALKDTVGRKSTPEPRFDPEKYEPVVKTPPEPTRVKSPDQVRSCSKIQARILYYCLYYC